MILLSAPARRRANIVFHYRYRYTTTRGITYLDPLLDELLRELRLLRDFLRPRLRDRDDSEELKQQNKI
jgi:hypothetical protein